MTTTYYDVPLLKAPVWTWEVPLSSASVAYCPVLSRFVMRTFQRSPGWRRGASVAALAGSLLTRIGWLLAGRVSAEGRLKKHASTDESDAYASTV